MRVEDPFFQIWPQMRIDTSQCSSTYMCQLLPAGKWWSHLFISQQTCRCMYSHAPLINFYCTSILLLLLLLLLVLFLLLGYVIIIIQKIRNFKLE